MFKSFYIFLFISPLLSFSQALAFLDVSTEVFGSKVRVNWEVAAGNQCQDVEVQHSLDGETFETIYTYAGICGDPNVTLGYDYTHKYPTLNHANYYRLKVNQDITKPTREFVAGKNQINLIRNERERYIEVDFYDFGGPFTMSIYSTNGALLYTESHDELTPTIYLPEVATSHYKILIIEQNGIVRSKKY
jgi:hypothetical protein